MPEALEIAALPAAPDLAAVVAAWLGRLAGERRLSANTVEAYGRDARQFLAFLAGRLGAPAGIAQFSALSPADLRAFLAARRADGIDPRSLQRALSALRSLARQVVRDGVRLTRGGEVRTREIDVLAAPAGVRDGPLQRGDRCCIEDAAQ